MDDPTDEPIELDVTAQKLVDEDKLIDEIASYFEDRGMKILLGQGTPNGERDPVMAGHIMAFATMVRSGTWRGFKNGA